MSAPRETPEIEGRRRDTDAPGKAAPRRRKVRVRPRNPGEMPGYLISFLFSGTWGCSTAIISAGIFLVVITVAFWILLRVAH